MKKNVIKKLSFFIDNLNAFNYSFFWVIFYDFISDIMQTKLEVKL